MGCPVAEHGVSLAGETRVGLSNTRNDTSVTASALSQGQGQDKLQQPVPTL